MEENKQNFNNGGPWWKPGVELFSEVSTWIVVPIVLALIAGKALDTHFGTKPVIFLALTGFAFLVTCYGVYRVIKNYIKKFPDQSRDPDKGREKDK